MSERSRNRRRRPALEGMERREMPSIVPMLVSRTPVVKAAAVVPDDSTGQPTRHEARRQAFYAIYPTRFTTGRGRFTDQTFQTFHSGQARGGASNFFFRSDMTLATVQSTDPTQPVAGQAYLFDRNANNTGNILVLDLKSTGPVDRLGRPKRMTWTVNSGGGSFEGAEGEGTLKITYRNNGRVGGRVLAAGQAALVFQGSVYTTGISDLTRF